MHASFPHKIFRTVGISIVGIMLLIALIGAQFSRHYKSLIRSRLPALSAKATDSLYDITIQDIRINIFTRSVTVYGLRMSVNADVLQRRRMQGRPPHVVLDVTVPRATVSGVRWNELSAERELDCRVVRFYKPEIRVLITPDWERRDSLRPKRPAAIRRVYAGRIFIEEPLIDVRYTWGENAFAVQSSGGSITASDWDFHPRQPFDTARFFAAATADVSLRNISYSHPGARYLFSLGGLSFNTVTRSASLQALRIKPAAPYDVLYSIIGHRADIYDCSLPEVGVDSLDWKALLVRHALRIGRIGLREPQLSIYQSKRPPPVIDSVRLPYPHQRLQMLRLPVAVGSIAFWDAGVGYSETSGKTGATGTILFHYLRGALFNITNDSTHIARMPICRGFVSGKFMYRSDIAAVVDIDQSSRRGDFTIRGALHNLDASQIREPVSAMAMAVVASLSLREAQIAIRGNEDSTWGDYTIRYNALRVKLKKWDEEDSDVHSRVLLSFLANKLLLYRDNPMAGEAVRHVRAEVARGNTRSFFRTVWKNIFQGMALTAIREEGAYDIAKRRVANQGKQKQPFFKGLFPKRRRDQ